MPENDSHGEFVFLAAETYRYTGDAALLRLAHAYDAATRWVARRPPTDPLTGDPA